MGIGLRQGLVQIGDEVVCVFNSYAQANQPISDSRFFSDLFGNAGMGHGGRMANQAFHTTERFGEREQFVEGVYSPRDA